MIDTYRNAQRAYDHQAPDDTPAFLDTKTGQGWLSDCVDTLMTGDDVKIGGKTVVGAHEFFAAVTKASIERNDSDDFLGQLLVAVWDYDICKASSCLHQLLGTGYITQLAKEICEPHAEAAKQQMIEDGEWEE